MLIELTLKQHILHALLRRPVIMAKESMRDAAPARAFIGVITPCPYINSIDKSLLKVNDPLLRNLIDRMAQSGPRQCEQ